MLKLFCDGSVNPQSKIGFGAYFILEDEEKDIEGINNKIKTKIYKYFFY